jgi:hypothetical protein
MTKKLIGRKNNFEMKIDLDHSSLIVYCASTDKILIFGIHKKNGLLIPDSFGVGKSGHHRAAKRITSVGREIRTSATESMYIHL